MNAEQWRPVILEYTSGLEVQNPFLDIVITAEFTGPSGRKITREAYWDGGNSYKVSFAPPELGRWSYVVTAPEGTGLNGLRGSLQCVPYSGELPIYKHGFIKVAGPGSYLAYDDDTPFFWLGDTHWAFVSGERWDESNHPQMDSMFRGMVDRRCQQGFTVYQTNLRPEAFFGGTHYWEDGQEGRLPDVKFYQDEVDKRMEYIADKGLVNALGLAWFMSGLQGLDTMKGLARYIIARYGGYPMVWTLAGEVAGYYPETREACINAWREVARLIEKLDDGCGTLQTAHYTNERPFADYYQDETWFDFTLNQAGHGDFVISAKDFLEHREKHPNKPFVEGEAMYEFVYTLEENGGRTADAATVRRAAYTAMQCGACGYTYGAQGIWDTVWEKPEKPNYKNAFNPLGVTWYEAVDGIAAVQMGYMRGFYEKYHFERLRPAGQCYQVKGSEADNGPFDMFKPLISASHDMDTVIVYFNTYTRSPEAQIRYLKNKPYRMAWFDPRTGGEAVLEQAAVPVDGRLDMPERPTGEDWLLVLSCE